MLHDVVQVEPLPAYRLRLRFDDGATGEADVRAITPLDGVFADLQDPAVFSQARIDPELGCVCWPNGADLDSDVLYSAVTGAPLPGQPTAASS